MMTLIDVRPIFPYQIVFTDKATFTLTGELIIKYILRSYDPHIHTHTRTHTRTRTRTRTITHTQGIRFMPLPRS